MTYSKCHMKVAALKLMKGSNAVAITAMAYST
jgi:hypothetical protein